ncbi:MFS transporter [Rugosimonospora africana]|uniref:MFS transporter n=2 Tax=Rugosimonospora africana TaxID=556532 RepID=A0A8J3VSC8_9ACTN|nr:MFS transporter [Rugosimonospora africana]
MGMATTREAAATAVRPAGTPGRSRWLAAGVAVCTVGWGANQFAPMVLLYRARLGLSAAVVEGTFGMYAIGLMPGLLVAGRVSDRVGRRPVVMFSVALSMVAGIVLAFGAHGVGWLFAGRVVMGVASGCAFSAGSAWIKELSAPPYEAAVAGAGARRASVAMTVGFGAGPLVAGALAQWAPWPTTLPYAPQLALAAYAVVLVARLPETVTRSPSASRVGLGVHGLGERRFRWVVLPLAPWVFGAAAISMVFVPGLVIDRVHGIAVFFGALAAVCTAMAGVLVQPLARRLDRRDGPHLLVAGMSLVTVGLVIEAGVAAAGQPILALPAAAVLGCGYGCCMVYGLAEVQRMSRPEELATLTAVFQAATYIGFGAPTLLSVLESYSSPTVLLLAVAGLAALTLAVTSRQARR